MKPLSIPCDYCTRAAALVDSSIVYHGRSYGPIYYCGPCQAWVGCHPNTTQPLGRLANAELRKWKQAVHAVFDPVWKRRLELKRKVDPAYTRAMARGGRYRELAVLMGIAREECHIGMFDVERCALAVKIIQSVALERVAAP